MDKRSPEGRGVEKAVNPPVNKRLSTELSTLLITYSRVVSELLRALKPAMTRVSAAIPTTFPHLWITCGKGHVVKWKVAHGSPMHQTVIGFRWIAFGMKGATLRQ